MNLEFLYKGVVQLVTEDWKMLAMWVIGGLLIYLAIKKDMEPTLLLPMGFGAILVNLPFSGAIGAEGTHAGLVILIGISAIGQEVMYLLDKRHRQRCCDIVYHIAHTDEMVHHLHNIIHLGWFKGGCKPFGPAHFLHLVTG